MRTAVDMRRLSGLVALGLVLALSSGWTFAANAWASKGVVALLGAPGSGDGQFAPPSGVAVNASTGDVYVVDQGGSRIEQFDSSGAFVRAFGWGVADGASAPQTCTTGCQPGLAGSGDGQFDGPQAIAVDQATGALYVVDANNSRVEKFSAAGGYEMQFGLAGSAEADFAGPQGVALDPTDGSVYVADAGNNRVQKFTSSGAFVRTFGFGVSDGTNAFEICTNACEAGLPVADDGGFAGPSRVAVDSTGRVYVLDAGNGRIERYTSAGAFDEVFDPGDIFAPQELAIGPGNDDVFVAQWAQDFSEQHVIEVSSGGSLVDTDGVGATVTGSAGLAVGAADQKLYLSDAGSSRIFVLDDVTPPTLSLDPPGAITATSASLSGSVTPNGDPSVGWHFETSTDDAAWAPASSDQDAGDGATPTPVSQDLIGLVPNTTYFVRLAGTRPFNSPTYSPETQFTTLAIAPDVTTQAATDVASRHATLAGLIDPHNADTHYYFQYGQTTAYGASAPAAQDADAGSTETLTVLQPVYGLAPDTTYHYRLVARNQAGVVQGTDQTFTTSPEPSPSPSRAGIPGSGFLPDDRGWELVSPVVKHGNDVMADSARTRAAGDGTAVTFASLGGLSDVRGTGVASEYMGVRDRQPGTSGWNTHAITPRQQPLTARAALFSMDPLYDGEFSPDLSQGVFRAWSPLTDASAVAAVENLYVRNDLRSAGAGSYQLITACPFCAVPLSPVGVTGRVPRLAGASADFTHVLFESSYQLTADAPVQGPTVPNLYEWDHGVVRFAGVLPDGSSAQASIAGQGASFTIYTPHTISADGSRLIFTDNSTTGGQSGALYMRVNHDTTVQINASERTDCADQQPCTGAPEPDPAGPAPARYWTASTDASRVFFTSSEQLTNDDNNSAEDLYMFDATAAVGHRLTRLGIDHNPADAPGEVSGVMGASDDGHTVYFISGGQLVSGGPVLGADRGIFEWHDGQISYIGRLANPGTDTAPNVPGTNFSLIPLAARVTSGGGALLFTSSSSHGLSGYDQGSCRGVDGCEELYLYTSASHLLRCVSCNPTGAPATFDAIENVRTGTSGAVTASHLNHALSDDGRYVFFSTADALVPEDANGKYDAYEYDATSGTVHLLSSGTDPSDSYFVDASADGKTAFFLTREQLVGWDTDQNYDLYAARVDGGFPEPPPVSTCAGESCHGPLVEPTQATVPGSVGFDGPGNVRSTTHRSTAHKKKVTPKRCARGQKRVRTRGNVRCVKQRARAKRKSKARKRTLTAKSEGAAR